MADCACGNVFFILMDDDRGIEQYGRPHGSLLARRDHQTYIFLDLHPVLAIFILDRLRVVRGEMHISTKQLV
jgi:hypothetical protein